MRIGQAVIAILVHRRFVQGNRVGMTCEELADRITHMPLFRNGNLSLPFRGGYAVDRRCSPQDVNAAISGFNNRQRNPWRRCVSDGEPLPNTPWRSRRWVATEVGKLKALGVVADFEEETGMTL